MRKVETRIELAVVDVRTHDGRWTMMRKRREEEKIKKNKKSNQSINPL